MSPTSELLPDPETPLTQTNRPSGKATSTSLRLCCRAPRTVSQRSPGGFRSVGMAIDFRPDRYCPVRLLGASATSSERPLGDDLAPFDAGAGAEVDEVVGGAHRVLVVLDDDHGVADVAEALQGRDQAVIVARVEADRRLVEDVQDPDQPRADLAGQADPLRLAARERGRRPVEGEVIEPDVVEEAEPTADLLEEFLGDRLRQGVELGRAVFRGQVLGRLAGQGVEEAGDPRDRDRPEFDQGLAADPDGAGARVEPGAVAVGAGHAPHVRFER